MSLFTTFIMMIPLMIIPFVCLFRSRQEFDELFICLGEANEHESITVPELASIIGLTEEETREHLEYGLHHKVLAGTMDGDMFVRRHRMRKLHADYLYWKETDGHTKFAWE